MDILKVTSALAYGPREYATSRVEHTHTHIYIYTFARDSTMVLLTRCRKSFAPRLPSSRNCATISNFTNILISRPSKLRWILVIITIRSQNIPRSHDYSRFLYGSNSSVARNLVRHRDRRGCALKISSE